MPLSASRFLSKVPISSLSSSSSIKQGLYRSMTLQNLLKRGFSPTVKALNVLLSFLIKSHKYQLALHVLSQFSSNSSIDAVSSNSSTNYFIARALLKCRRFEEAEGLIARRERSDLSPRKCLWDMLIRGVCGVGGDPEKALSLLRECVRNHGMLLSPRTFRVLVLSFCTEGKMEGAVEVVDLMNDGSGGCPFDDFDCSSIIGLVVDGFCEHGDVEKAIGFFNEVEKMRMEDREAIYIAAMQGFCRRGKLQEAMRVLRKLAEMEIAVDELIYSDLISGFCSNGDMDRVFDLVKEMEGKGIKAGAVTYNAVINGLCKYRKMSHTNKLPGVSSCVNSSYVTSLQVLLKEANANGLLEAKKRLEESGISVDIVTCNVLIKALFRMGYDEDAHLLFRKLPEMGLVADSVTYFTVVDECCKLGMIDKALELFDEFRRTSVSSADCHSSIIRGLCMEGMLERAEEVFQDLLLRDLLPNFVTCKVLMRTEFKEDQEKGVLKLLHWMEKLHPDAQCVIYNYSVAFLCRKDCFDTAFHICLFMRSKGFGIASKSYYVIIKRLIFTGKKHLVRLMLTAYLKEYGMFEPRVVNILSLYLCKKNIPEALCFLRKMGVKKISSSVSAAVVGSLKNDGKAQEAHKFVLEAEEKGVDADVVAYSIVVDSLCKEGYLEKALELCAIMKKRGTLPNIVTYNSVINGLCRQGCLLEAFRLFNSLEQNNVIPTIITYGTLIDALSREGFLEDATQIFERMVLKNVAPNKHIYNSLIYGYCSFGLMDESLTLLHGLEQNLLQPDAFTASALISGFCVKGDMEGALGFYGEYKRKGVPPDFLGFTSLIKGLCTKGRMEEARTILRDMLQCQSITDMIDKAGDGIDVESLASLLSILCEEGNVRDAINLLNEIGCYYFPSVRCNGINRPRNFLKFPIVQSIATGSDRIGSNMHPIATRVQEHGSESLDSNYITEGTAGMNIGLHSMGKDDEGFENYEMLMRSLPSHDFDAYYSLVASLFSKGELQKAKSVVKAMLLNYR